MANKNNLEGTICPKCGKEFFPYPQHIYKCGSKRYCSWTCFNHKDDGKPSKNKAVLQYTLDGVFIREFESAKQAADFIDGTANYIRYVCLGQRKSAYKSIWKYKE